MSRQVSARAQVSIIVSIVISADTVAPTTCTTIPDSGQLSVRVLRLDASLATLGVPVYECEELFNTVLK